MYKKNTKTQVPFAEKTNFEHPFINYSHCKHFSPQTSLISQQIKTHLDKQIFTLHSPDNTLITRLIPFLEDNLGTSAKIRNRAGHHRRIALREGNSRIVVYSEPSTHQDPIVAVLYGSARFESSTIKNLLTGNLVLETCCTGCKSLAVKTSKDPQEILCKFISGVRKLGYELITDTKHRNYYYLENRTWDAESFRVTLRYEPVHMEMAPALLQIDKFTPDEKSYVDLVWLVKSIQGLDITLKPHEIEYQTIFLGADETMVLDLLRKVTLKAVRTLGYSNERGVIVRSYNIKTSVRELLTCTHYIGNSRSSIQTRIYKKADQDPKLEFVVRDRFLSKIRCKDPEDLFNKDIWDSIAGKVLFGTLEVDASRRSKNREHFQRALQKARTSLHSAKQTIPANPHRYIKTDAAFSEKVGHSFRELHDLLTYVWSMVEGETKNTDVFTEKTPEIGGNKETTETIIFPELIDLPRLEVKTSSSSPATQNM